MTEPESVGSLGSARPTGLEPESRQGEDFAWFMLAVLASFYWFDWVLLRSLNWTDATRRHYYIYVCTLFGVLPLGLATCGLLRLVRNRLLGGNRNFLPILIFVQAAFWVWVWARSEERLLLPELLRLIRWAIPVMVVAAVGLAHGCGPKRQTGWSLVQSVVFYALPILGLVFLWHFKGDATVKRSMIVVFAVVALALAAPVIRRRGKFAVPRDRWDAVFSILLVLLVVPTVLEINYFHQSFYLGPVNEVEAGRSMLVDVTCQYGVGVIYFLAAAFKLLFLRSHYGPFTALLVTLTTLQFLLLYWIVRRIFQSRVLAMYCLVALVILSRIGFYHEDNIVFPSVGPLRFGLPLLILAAGFVRRSRPSSRCPWGWIEAGLLGVASIWSLETFVYSLAALGFSTVAEAWALRTSLLDFALRCLRGALRPTIAIAAAVAGLTLMTLLRSGRLPHLDQYMIFLTLYSGTFAAWDLALWTPWILLPGMVCLSLLATALRTQARRNLDPGHFFIAGLAGAAAAEFSYFIERSHPTNLTHLAAPIVLLLFYWLDQSWKGAGGAWQARWTALPVALLILIGLSWSSEQSIWSYLDRSLMAWTVRKAGALIDGEPMPIPDVYAHIWSPQPTSPRAAAHLQLAAKYAPKQREISVITPDALEFYSLTGRRDPFPIGCVAEDGLLPGYFEKIAAAPLPLKSGEVLLIVDDSKGTLDGPPLVLDEKLQPLVTEIKQHFKLEPLQRDDATGVWAARLALAEPPETAGAPKP
jgi:hypothetical protein